MDKKLYRILARNTSYYYVCCHPAELEAWFSVLDSEGHGDDIFATEVNLSDFDEINHNHFC